MTSEAKLTLIRLIHTAIWIFFNGVILYIVYAVLTNRLDYRLWICYGLIIMEGITLSLFRLHCPLTVWARKYSNSVKDNFDIYLSEWLARHNKLIYTSIMIAITMVLIYKLLRR
jgi:hypothetical protein